MLIALITLLLPLCKVTTATHSTTVSGLEVVKIGVNVGYEYSSKGKIDEDYVLRDSLTWGDIRDSATFLSENGALRNVIVGGIVAGLPIVFCFLAMLFTLMAQGKKTMILPTLFIALTFLESIVLIIIFFRLRALLLPNVDMMLLVGSYAFTMLSGIAFMILGLLWMTGGFLRPKDKNDDCDEKNDKRKKKKSPLVPDKKKGRRKRNRKNKKRSKKKTRRNNLGKEDQYNELKVTGVGHIIGLTGIYQGMDLELVKLTNATVTIGTTKEAVAAIQKGTMNQMDKVIGAYCVIAYSEESKQYTITSYSGTEILLKTNVQDNSLIRLREGDSKIVDTNTLVYVGDYNNSISLK